MGAMYEVCSSQSLIAWKSKAYPVPRLSQSISHSTKITFFGFTTMFCGIIQSWLYRECLKWTFHEIFWQKLRAGFSNTIYNLLKSITLRPKWFVQFIYKTALFRAFVKTALVVFKGFWFATHALGCSFIKKWLLSVSITVNLINQMV